MKLLNFKLLKVSLISPKLLFIIFLPSNVQKATGVSLYLERPQSPESVEGVIVRCELLQEGRE